MIGIKKSLKDKNLLLHMSLKYKSAYPKVEKIKQICIQALIKGCDIWHYLKIRYAISVWIKSIKTLPTSKVDTRYLNLHKSLWPNVSMYFDMPISYHLMQAFTSYPDAQMAQ